MSASAFDPDAEHQQFIATLRRMNAETEKFVAEQRKLTAEARKFDRERITGAVLAGAALGAAVLNLLGFLKIPHFGG